MAVAKPGHAVLHQGVQQDSPYPRLPAEKIEFAPFKGITRIVVAPPAFSRTPPDEIGETMYDRLLRDVEQFIDRQRGCHEEIAPVHEGAEPVVRRPAGRLDIRIGTELDHTHFPGRHIESALQFSVTNTDPSARLRPSGIAVVQHQQQVTLLDLLHAGFPACFSRRGRAVLVYPDPKQILIEHFHG